MDLSHIHRHQTGISFWIIESTEQQSKKYLSTPHQQQHRTVQSLFNEHNTRTCIQLRHSDNTQQTQLSWSAISISETRQSTRRSLLRAQLLQRIQPQREVVRRTQTKREEAREFRHIPKIHIVRR